MTDRIDLTGIEVTATHGVLAVERAQPQLFLVDVSVFTDFAAAVGSDDLSDAIDYGSLAEKVHDVVAGESHSLIESVAHRVVEEVLSDWRVERAIVTIHKPQAPIDVPFHDVTVTVDRSR